MKRIEKLVLAKWRIRVRQRFRPAGKTIGNVEERVTRPEIMERLQRDGQLLELA
jgi:hypothetical protein